MHAALALFLAHVRPGPLALPAPATGTAETVDATLIARLPDGRAIVELQGACATVAAPAAALPGALVRVPAAAFAAAAPPTQDSPTMRPASLPAPSDPLPALAPTARSVAALAAGAAEVAIRDPLPLADGEPVPPQAAARLRQAVEASGLFYEAHVAEWAQGVRPLATLAREPQAALARPRSSAHRNEPRTAAPPHDAMRERAPAVATDEAPRAVVPAHAGAEALAVPPAARELVAQQLALLADPRFAWRGEAWPGQPATIEIAEEHAAPGDPEAQRSWRLALAVELPALGRVEAEIRAAGGRCAIGVRAATGALDALAGARSGLEDALAAAGVDTAVRIERHA